MQTCTLLVLTGGDAGERLLADVMGDPNSDSNTGRIVHAFCLWRGKPPPVWRDGSQHGGWHCEDIPGFCKARTLPASTASCSPWPIRRRLHRKGMSRYLAAAGFASKSSVGGGRVKGARVRRQRPVRGVTRHVLNLRVIQSFACKDTRALFEGENPKRFRSFAAVAERKLAQFAKASTSCRLHRAIASKP